MNKFMCFVLLLTFSSSCGDTAKKGGKGSQLICGNGVLDSGEKCDSAIAAGVGACQETCAAPACSTATLVGSSDSCDAECIVEPIACKNDDGCCPIGCDSQTDTDCTNTCGNGVLEIPELCDGDDCPSVCDSTEVCTSSILNGSAQDCSATCDITTIEVCVDGDGCCPENCSSDTDTDCEKVSTCGNGIIDGSESCDGDCPETCSDNDACSVDQRVGSAEICTARCVFTQIDACISGDGCCAPGCNAETDADCDPSCGNGTIDEDEICDGNCPSACDDNMACTSDKLLGSPSTCDSECSYTTINTCKNDDGCCPNNCEFANDNDCACVPDTCASLNLQCGSHSDGCNGTINCGGCTNGTCNNASGLCEGGVAGADGDRCTMNTECGGLSVCLNEPGGYCSAICFPGLDTCGMESSCTESVSSPGTGQCRKDCTVNADCRSGYSCMTTSGLFGTYQVCLPN